MIFTVLGMNGPYAAADGAGSGYLLSDDKMENRVLLDCGPGVLGRLQKYYKIQQLSGVVLSHLHYDHMSDMLAMQYALQRQPTQLRVIAPDSPEVIRKLLDAPCFATETTGQQAEVGPFRFEFIPAAHPVRAYSMAISQGGRRIVYTGDTNLNSALEEFAAGADLLVADGAFLSEQWGAQKPRMAAAQCARLAKNAGVGRLMVTHLAPGCDRMRLLEQAAEIFPDTVLATEDMTLRV